MHYIKIEGNKVTLAGQVATQEMLDDGYIEYNGPIPPRSHNAFLRWDDVKNEIYEDTDSRIQAELAGIRKRRDELLTKSDWVVAKSAETGIPVPQEWLDYRQALRDITIDYTPGKVFEFPFAPNEVIGDGDPTKYASYTPGTHVDATPPGTPFAVDL